VCVYLSAYFSLVARGSRVLNGYRGIKSFQTTATID
jgi:hypothetical protein